LKYVVAKTFVSPK